MLRKRILYICVLCVIRSTFPAGRQIPRVTVSGHCGANREIVFVLVFCRKRIIFSAEAGRDALENNQPMTR